MNSNSSSPIDFYESRIVTLERETRRLTRRMSRREKVLTERILSLRREIHDQATRFERKFADSYSSTSLGSKSSLGDSDSSDDCEQRRRYLTTVAEEANPDSSSNHALESLLAVESSGGADKDDLMAMESIRQNSSTTNSHRQRPPEQLIVVSYSTSATQTDSLLFDEDDFVDELCREKITRRENLEDDVDEPEAEVEGEEDGGGQRRMILLEHFARGQQRSKVMDELELAAEGFIDDTDFDEECQPGLYDVEYEEVTLQRSDGCDKLGLTLCYGKGDDVDTDIFVSEIEEQSIAFRDGRIRIGDQILQINGVDVHTRNQAMEQFRRRDRNEIALLLARSVLNSQASDIMTDTAVEEERSCSAIREQTPEEEDGHLTDGTKGSMGSAHEKDSGISRATDSDPELPPPIDSPSKSSSKSIVGGQSLMTKDVRKLTTTALTTPDYLLDFATNLNKFRSPATLAESEHSSDATPTQANQSIVFGNRSPGGEQSTSALMLDRSRVISQASTSSRGIDQSTQSMIPPRSSADQSSSPTSVGELATPKAELPPSIVVKPQKPSTTTNNPWRLDRRDDSSLERELHYLHQEMEHIQLECDRLIEQHAKSDAQVRAQIDQANDRLKRNSAANGSTDKSSKSSGGNTSKSQGASTIPSKNFYADHQPPHQSQTYLTAIGLQSMTPRDETSSAYNTGNESCRSTPLKTMEQHPQHHQSPYSDGKRDSAVFTLPSAHHQQSAIHHRQSFDHPHFAPGQIRMAAGVPIGEYEREKLQLQLQLQQQQQQQRQHEFMLMQQNRMQQQQSSSGGANSSYPGGDLTNTMYTNSENLHRTILLQQRLLREAMIQQAQQLRQQQEQEAMAGGGGGSFGGHLYQNIPVESQNWTDNDRLRWLMQQQQQQHSGMATTVAASSTSQFAQGQSNGGDGGDIVKMEWKIKRRSDGSRYLARRPVRNKMLKERAEKLSNERCGLSTDDDAFSELKIGRYWTREERKKHLERAKERKRRQEELLRRKAESLQKTSDQPILELSNKKMLRRQGQQLFDKFTTVQEFLAHGSRSAEGRALGILSVTTV